MPLTTTDLLLGPPRLTDDHVAALFRHIDQPDAKDQQFVMHLRHWCKVAGVDDANALSQAIWETGDFTSVRWNRDLNPVGLGITSDGTIQPFDIRTVDEAARVTVQAIYAMVMKQWHPGVPMPESCRSWMDGVWLKKVQDPAYPKGVDQVQDQNIIYSGNRATWAVDGAYMGHVKRFNSYVPGVPDQGVPPKPEQPGQIVFGRVPHPPFLDRPITKPAGFGQDNLGRRTVKGVVWHRVVGSLWGTDSHFRNPSVGALTDYGVGTLAMDGAANDGVIIRWNNPLGYQSGWASGSYSAAHAYGDGLAFVNDHGVDAINRDQASIEISGQPNTPLSPACKRAVAELTAYWADQAKIPYTQFPRVVGKDYSFVRWHEEFGPDNGTKKCPFDVVKQATPDMIDLTVSIMQQYQGGATPEPKPKPEPEQPARLYPPGMGLATAKRLYKQVTVPWASKPFTFDPDRRECQLWLEAGKAQLKEGERYDRAKWPRLVDVIRRGDGSRIYHYSDGTAIEIPKEA